MFNKGTVFTILGLARSGISASYKLKQFGYDVFLSEMKSEQLIEGSNQLKIDFPCEFGGHSERALDCDVMIVSPGIPLNVPILDKARDKGILLISEIELGYRLKSQKSKIIAVTGSNGKSTTVSLIDHILTESGYKSILAGNIGDAFTSFPIEDETIDFFVLELSSFQLDLIDRFHPEVAAVLNVTPDHLNRYTSFDDYAKSKFGIFKNQTEQDISIINHDDSVSMQYLDMVRGNHLYFSGINKGEVNWTNRCITRDDIVYDTSRATIRGPHNQSNIAAAIAAVSPWIKKKEIIEAALANFKPLPHRLELCGEINGVTFYNDSKATNTDSVRYALQSFNKPVHIIMGGAGKGEDYSVLIPELKKYAAKSYLVGTAKEDMAKAFDGAIDYEIFVSDNNPRDAIRLALEAAMTYAKPGDVVILSPACTSYDMFKNFEERGIYFKQLIKDRMNGERETDS